MKRALVLFALIAAFCMVASQASATTSIPVKMTFTEPIVPGIVKGCSVAPDGFCGSGQVIPLGRATETIAFGGGCGGSCDLRTIYLKSGTIVLDETFSDGSCPGACQPNPAEPDSGLLNDVIVGGTGAFEGASGTLSGSVNAAGPQSTIKLTGTIVLA